MVTQKKKERKTDERMRQYEIMVLKGFLDLNVILVSSQLVLIFKKIYI